MFGFDRHYTSLGGEVVCLKNQLLWKRFFWSDTALTNSAGPQPMFQPSGITQANSGRESKWSL
jgi:hypothetical protein